MLRTRLVIQTGIFECSVVVEVTLDPGVTRRVIVHHGSLPGGREAIEFEETAKFKNVDHLRQNAIHEAFAMHDLPCPASSTRCTPAS